MNREAHETHAAPSWDRDPDPDPSHEALRSRWSILRDDLLTLFAALICIATGMTLSWMFHVLSEGVVLFGSP